MARVHLLRHLVGLHLQVGIVRKKVVQFRRDPATVPSDIFPPRFREELLCPKNRIETRIGPEKVLPLLIREQTQHSSAEGRYHRRSGTRA